MRLDSLIGNQLLVAQSIFALAEHIGGATGAYMEPVPFDELPSPPRTGMISCVSDSTAAVPGTAVSGGGTYTVLAWYVGAQWRVLGGVAPFTAAGQVNVASPAGTASTSWVMMGLGLVFTAVLPRAIAVIDGQITNSINNGETDAQLMYGLAITPPSNGALPPSGAVVIGSPIRFKAASGGGSFTPFSQSGLITGLSPGQHVWIDLALQVVTGIGTVTDISLLAHELL
jgi:hypothetical protein